MTKKLNIAFIWHFHQPIYQENYNEDFLMPWVRLHSSKDYYDMLWRIENFKNIRLNFNISPVLVGSIERYLQGNHDIHSRLLISDVDTLNIEDKNFILQHFFDANYANMILKRPYYASLYNKRYSKENISTDAFDNQEYADIMANFTLCWIDKKFVEMFPNLSKLMDKEQGYTLEDRKEIFNIQLEIFKKLPDLYKKFQNQNRIEISTNPFYHPILPLLLDINEDKYQYSENLPEKSKLMEEDAIEQTKKSLDKFEEFFGKRPKGVWLPEQCISKKAIELLSDLNVKWTVADEGILANSIKKEFTRDFEGNLEDPYDLCANYKLKDDTKTNIIFADSFFANLVGFGYGNYEGEIAANDFYEKIKTIQNKLENSPKEEHLLTIAMDGENCWESYPNDGEEFLNTLYSLIENDPSLETVLVSEFLEKSEPILLEELSSGSWINRNFDLWIGEPTKNIAWLYLDKTRTKLEEVKEKLLSEAKTGKAKAAAEALIDKAKQEIFIAQGSDWFWWYGEPNESGNDHIFDYLFRAHLKNVYKILNEPHPGYLDIPLISIIGKPVREPKRSISPIIDGVIDDSVDNWADAGYIFLPDSPTFSAEKTIKGIYYGSDDTNVYFKFELNRKNITNSKHFLRNQIFLYFRSENQNILSPVRTVSKTENIYPIIENQFTHEVSFSFNDTEMLPLDLAKSTFGGLWISQLLKRVNYAYRDTIEIAISFEDLGIQEGESVEFCILAATKGVLNEVYPQDVLLTLTR
ncbi:MAG: glycoside hydrolase family 57 protein [Candidatus Gastranaerophilales bacterium]|nr:glycoside hydrolase family 57 protein [Candidatus Gastranaerophilales bacterium]